MNFIPSNRPIHICVRPHDLRYGARFLLAQARNSQEKFDYDGFYVYTNARYTLIKILWLEGRHICMCVRRLNKGTYRWPKAGQNNTSEWRLLKRHEFVNLMERPREYQRKTLRDLLQM